MNKNKNLFTLAPALLLFAAALGLTGCSQSEDEPGNLMPEGKITLAPSVEVAAGWNAGSGDGAATRADRTVPILLAEGGEISISIKTAKDADILSCNYYTVTKEGKLSRLPFANRPSETEAPLNVNKVGDYFINSSGALNFTVDGFACQTSLQYTAQTAAPIGADGKITVPLEIQSFGIRLDVQNTDGTTYTGSDVSASLKNLRQMDGAAIAPKTLSSATPSAIWGDLDPSVSLTGSTEILQLTVGSNFYKVNSPKTTFLKGRLYTFKVRVGATGITVSSDDLKVGDFEVEAETKAEAELVPSYNGKTPNLLAIPGKTAYWVAPEDAVKDGNVVNDMWGGIYWSTVCPEGWKAPSKDDFDAMLTYGSTYRELIRAAFPANKYWDSVNPNSGGTVEQMNYLDTTDDNISIKSMSWMELAHVRCVRQQ